MARRSCLQLVALTLALAAAPTAVAQQRDASEATCARARELFEAGTDAVDRGRLAEGRELLRGAAALCPIVQVWFNLAFALRRSGFTTEAVEIFQALLQGRYGALSPEQERTIRQEASGASRELATVRLTLRPPVAANIELDGAAAGTARARTPFTVHLDAGAHVIAASLGNASGHTRVEVMRGQVLDLSLDLEEQQGDLIPLWAWISGGAVVGVALVVTIILLALPSPLPERGLIVET